MYVYGITRATVQPNMQYDTGDYNPLLVILGLFIQWYSSTNKYILQNPNICCVTEVVLNK